MPLFRRRQREMADGKGAAAPPPPASAFAGAAPVDPSTGAPMAGPSGAAADGAMGPPPSYEQSEHMTKGPPMKPQGVYPPLPPNATDPAANPQQPQVIVQYVQMPSFGVHPVNLTCPHCQAHVRTTTESEPGPLAWILAGVLCVVG